MQALAFDVFGTLYDVAAVRDAVARVVPDPEPFLALWRRKQLEYTFQLALMGRFLPFSEVTRRALRYTVRELDVVLQGDEEGALSEAWGALPLHPGAREALTVLGERYTLVVLSNGDRGLLLRLLEGEDVRAHFAHVLSAEEAETFKPSGRVYRLATERLDLPARQVGLVSSNPFDVLGAKAAGLQALWVNRRGVPLDPLDLSPDLEVPDFAGLVAALAGDEAP